MCPRRNIKNIKQTDENDTEKSAKLVIDHVANKSVQYSTVLCPRRRIYGEGT
jgi:hypothetical protein